MSDSELPSSHFSLFNLSFLLALFRSLEKPSAHMINRYGLSGSPCLIPLFGVNSDYWIPLIATEYDTVRTHFITISIHLLQKPSIFIMLSMKSHSTLL
ncbi:hypothetical protein PVK06_002114 [Gossypium arboreum]|uniref:Uncharacterized protein n=1 Tax=Gossypium arboreum TaxID=29729 RepID=A0ABR0R448_GOSAR|nr:hypothetical protein PVK06_002114 [Gossypium arboreum]